MVCSGDEADGWNCEVWKAGSAGCCVVGRGLDGFRGRAVEVLNVVAVLNIEELDCVGLGWTGPMLRRRSWSVRSGSLASLVIAIDYISMLHFFSWLVSWFLDWSCGGRGRSRFTLVSR